MKFLSYLEMILFQINKTIQCNRVVVVFEHEFQFYQQ